MRTREEREALISRITNVGFSQHAGLHIREHDIGKVSLALEPKESLQQFMGYLHAGVITGLADHAAGAAFATTLPRSRICVSIELKINFLKPAKGSVVFAEAVVVSAGRSIGVVKSDVYAEEADEKIHCATAIVTLRAIDEH
ncbi:MAG: PaaI family thioesterase [Pseudomonadota bacterium]